MEQTLLEDLVIESIKIYGNDVYYLPMAAGGKDMLYGEVPMAHFNSAYPIEMYIKNIEGFGGEGQFLSKFNLEIRDEIEFSISSRTFSEEVGAPESINRPREGDLIWFPMANRMFKISYVSERPVFYQLGTVAFVDLRCQMFEFSNEVFTTGIPDIDILSQEYSLEPGVALMLEDGSVLVDETGQTLLEDTSDGTDKNISDNLEIQNIASGLIDFSEMDPFSEGVY
jgi:hypothetical protein